MKKRVTIKDVAAQAGVTYQTVSKVINGHAQVMPETEARILAASRALGYKPNHSARSLRAQRSQMIGYSWVPTGRNQANHILDVFLSSMVEEAEAAGYHLLPFPYREGDDHVNAYAELIDSGRVDGFVLSSVNYHDPRVQFLLEKQFPFVAFGRCEPEFEFPFVDINGESGLRLATQHLLDLGHRRIAALAWPADSRVGNDRLQGYFAAMQAAGAPVDPSWVARGTGSFEFGRAAATAWLALPDGARPTGVVALNDTMAIGALHAAQSSVALPGRHFSVVGFDDSPMAEYLWPSLSSVSQPIRLAGRKCVEMLVGLLTGEALPERHVLLEPELITRQSSGAV
ncbi:MAG: LacI family DNA-binding transcriptional regulator [Anaerolineales bacterium]